ncbi:MAG: HAD family hydrolase [Candidatus Hydrogenedentes bacterium]|nr:HAD family hydrolase [Candidatus Hydrogenedentota bacterium]
MPIRAITFDFWRTLFRDANSEERQRLRVDAFTEATGISPEVAAEAMKITWKEFDRHHKEEQRTLRPEDAVRLTTEALGICLEPAIAHELAHTFATAILIHSPVPIEGALDAVRAAADRFPIGLLSDSGVSPGSSLKALLERHGFLPYLKVLTFSDEVQVSKPQSLMFETAARSLGVNPSELLHIGDLEYTDVVGAHAVGAKAALFAGDNTRHLGATQADYTFTSWQEFINGLTEIR